MEHLYIIDKKKDLRKMIQITMKEAGPAILMTTATDFTAFLTGITSEIPMMRSFCLYAAICVLIDFLFQITMFVAVVTLRVRNGNLETIISILNYK